MGKKVTMKDIARRLSISTVTVSKALGEKDGVSEQLRGEIKQLASQMGYSYLSLPNRKTSEKLQYRDRRCVELYAGGRLSLLF